MEDDGLLVMIKTGLIAVYCQHFFSLVNDLLIKQSSFLQDKNSKVDISV